MEHSTINRKVDSNGIRVAQNYVIGIPELDPPDIELYNPKEQGESVKIIQTNSEYRVEYTPSSNTHWQHKHSGKCIKEAITIGADILGVDYVTETDTNTGLSNLILLPQSEIQLITESASNFPVHLICVEGTQDYKRREYLIESHFIGAEHGPREGYYTIKTRRRRSSSWKNIRTINRNIHPEDIFKELQALLR